MKRIILNPIIYLFTLIITTSCGSDTEWLDEVPEQFISTYYSASDDILLGYGDPLTIRISRKEIEFVKDGEDGYHRKERVIKVSSFDDDIIIFFGTKEEDYIASDRYKLSWGGDGFLYIYELISPYGDDDFEMLVGKFSDYNYRK